jgi:putative hydrolase of the HAD superfamily
VIEPAEFGDRCRERWLIAVPSPVVRTAVFWDFGGVILSSPFEAFNRYEAERGIPPDFIRRVNATDPDANAWARLERAEVDHAQFDVLFAAESAALGHRIPGADVLALLKGEIRPQMVEALRRIKAAGLPQACLTNNVVGGDGTGGRAITSAREAAIAEIMAMFDVVVESSKVGHRKPETRFYEIACELAAVTPDQVVFLDDLGINLKPAASMGMHTIKVLDPVPALEALQAAIGFPLL